MYSFIPGISLNRDDPHAFIQVINGISGETHYATYNLSAFAWEKDRFEARVGSSVFSREGIDLDIDSGDLKVKGRIGFSENVLYPQVICHPA